jgi:predicted AAA+ superfamily ATPase
MNTPSYPRFIVPRLEEALSDTPVVLLHGPRQSGKTTLAHYIAAKANYSYITFDDHVQLDAAQTDPMGFIANLPNMVILDEIQRVPELFTTIKASVDRDRRPGRFILTGSANVLLVPRLSDSLAGRIEILRIHPLSQSEIAAATDTPSEIPGTPSRLPDFLTRLFENNFGYYTCARLGASLAERITSGGYPSVQHRTPKRRGAWYRDYIHTMIQRDIQDLAHISNIDALSRLMTLTAGQTARMLNMTDLASPFQMSRPTIRDYVTLLSHVFLLEELPSWHSNRLNRLVKTPKLHIGDTGVACALLNITAEALHKDRPLLGQLLETFIYQELKRQASWDDDNFIWHHMRDRDGYEVDIVVEKGQQIAGIEIKASATVTSADFKALRRLRDATTERFSLGIVLYDGEVTAPFGDRLLAVPIRRIWEV